MDWKQLLRDGALIHQSVRAEQTRQALAQIADTVNLQVEEQAQQAWGMQQLLELQEGEQARAEQQRQLRQLTFELRQEADNALQERDLLERCISLLAVKDSVVKLDAAFLDDLRDKQWHADTLRLTTEAYNAAAGQLGHNAPEALPRFRSAVMCVQETATTLIEFDTNLGTGRPTQEEINEWRRMVAALAEVVAKAKVVAAGFPGLRLGASSLGKVIAAAKAAILVPASVDRFAFKCLVLLAKADSKLEPSEVEVLAEFGGRFRIPREEVQRLIAETRSVKKTEFQGDSKAAERIIRNLYRCALVDGRISAREGAMIKRIGLAIGVPEGMIARLAHCGDDDEEIAVLDTHSMLTSFAEALPTRAKKRAFFADAIPAKLHGWFTATFSIPADETPLAAGEWKALGIRTAAILVTNRFAYVVAPDRSYRIRVTDILSFSPGVFSGKLRLRDGATLKTPNPMNEFLQALCKAVLSSRRQV